MFFFIVGNCHCKKNTYLLCVLDTLDPPMNEDFFLLQDQNIKYDKCLDLIYFILVSEVRPT